MLTSRLGERTKLAIERFGLCQVRTDLDQFLPPVAEAREKINLEALGRLDVPDLGAPPVQLMQHNGLQSVPLIGPSRSIERRDQTLIHGIHLARIRIAPPLGLGGKRDTANQEGILQVCDHRMQCILRHAQAL